MSLRTTVVFPEPVPPAMPMINIFVRVIGFRGVKVINFYDLTKYITYFFVVPLPANCLKSEKHKIHTSNSLTVDISDVDGGGCCFTFWSASTRGDNVAKQ